MAKTKTEGVSVVIPLYNPDIGFLAANLKRLVLQENHLVEEILLVDDGSATPIRNYKNLLDSISSKIKITRQENRGAGAARNTGVKISRSKIIVFTDWDCVPHPFWIQSLIQPIIDNKAVAVGGKILTHFEDNLISKFSDFMQALREPIRDRQGNIIIIITANSAFLKSVFESVGGFDYRFKKAAGEDLDLTYRLDLAGYGSKFYYAPKAIVEHKHRTNLFSFLKQQFNYGYWDIYHFLLRSRDPSVMGVSIPTPINMVKFTTRALVFSTRLISRIPPTYGFSMKYFLFPSVAFIRLMAVMFGGAKCYYLSNPQK